MLKDEILQKSEKKSIIAKTCSSINSTSLKETNSQKLIINMV